MRSRPPHVPLRRAANSAALAASACLFLGACGNGGPGPSDDRTTLTVLYPNNDEWSIWNNEVPLIVFSPLVALSASGEVEGRLARSWEHSPDYRTWTIHLRSDIRWHDGEPFTARDVEFTVGLWKHPEIRKCGVITASSPL